MLKLKSLKKYSLKTFAQLYILEMTTSVTYTLTNIQGFDDLVKNDSNTAGILKLNKVECRTANKSVYCLRSRHQYPGTPRHNRVISAVCFYI